MKKPLVRPYGLDMTRKPNVRMTEAQEKALRELAALHGMSVGAYLRNAGLAFGGRNDLCDMPIEPRRKK